MQTDQSETGTSQFQRLRQQLPPFRGHGCAQRSQPIERPGPHHRPRHRFWFDRAIQSRLQGAYRNDAHRVPARAFGWNAEGAVGPLADFGIGKPVEELISRHSNSARPAIPSELNFEIVKLQIVVRIDLAPMSQKAAFSMRLTLPVSLPGLTGQSSIPGLWLLVLHRAWPDLQRMTLLLLCAGVVGTEVGVLLVRLSPFTSWTRGSWSTSDCRHGPSSAPEHAS